MSHIFKYIITLVGSELPAPQRPLSLHQFRSSGCSRLNWKVDRSFAARAAGTLFHLTFALLAWSRFLNLTLKSIFIDCFPSHLVSFVVLSLNLMMPFYWFLLFAILLLYFSIFLTLNIFGHNIAVLSLTCCWFYDAICPVVLFFFLRAALL